MKLSVGCPGLPQERDTVVDVWLDSEELQDDGQAIRSHEDTNHAASYGGRDLARVAGGTWWSTFARQRLHFARTVGSRDG